MMEEAWREISGSVERYLGLSPTLMGQIGWTLLIVLAALLAYMIGRVAITRRTDDVSKRYLGVKILRYVLGLTVLVLVFRVWVGSLTGFATYAGILSAGIAIAMQEPLVNLAGWMYIIVRKPFTTGDRIQISTHAGDVIDISLFQFTLVEIGNWVNADQSTGRIIHVPNGWVFRHSSCNYTQGFDFIWDELPMTVTFESNWQRAKEILTRIVQTHSAIKSEHAIDQIRKAAHRFMIFYQHLTPIVWTSVAPNGVTLTVRYLCSPRGRRAAAEKIWEEILRQFGESGDIEFAYPTSRVFRSNEESKRDLRPRPVEPDKS